MDTKQIAVKVDTHKSFKILSANEGISIRDLVEEAVELLVEYKHKQSEEVKSMLNTVIEKEAEAMKAFKAAIPADAIVDENFKPVVNNLVSNFIANLDKDSK